MKPYVWYLLAAFMEIAGCFAFWAWLRQHKSPWWALPGIAALICFAWALTRINVEHAGRAYAAYAGVYLLASVAWLWGVEKVRPDKWDAIGTAICIIGSLVILLGPRVK